MSDCPDTDAIVTIAAALRWNVADGLLHLLTCADCRTRLDALATTRSVLTETEPVADATLARISAALRADAHAGRRRTRSVHRWTGALETVLAGVAAPIALVSGGIDIGSVPAALLTFALGAVFLTLGRRHWPRPL